MEYICLEYICPPRGGQRGNTKFQIQMPFEQTIHYTSILDTVQNDTFQSESKN
jgi:hypothetical protein